MKFTHKNKPKFDGAWDAPYYEEEEFQIYAEKCHKWFEGFKKQEIDRKERAEKYIKQIKEGLKFRDNRNESFWLGYIHAKKEILE